MRWALGLAALLLLLFQAVAPAAGAPRWGWLGVRIRDLSEQEIEEISQRHGLREGFGALIVEVIKETPAEASGLKAGDVVVAVSDRPVVDTRALQRYIVAATVGETVAITVLRRDEGRRRVTVRIGPMPDLVAAERIAAEFGFLIRDAEGRPDIPAGPPDGPAAVAAVVPRSRAEAAGLKPGDLLVEVNGRPAPTLAAVREAMLTVSLEGALALVVRRGQDRLSLLLESPKGP
ncbi:MAG TPA: PDZ domain-containing protein [Methylomirabilota bacterium]|nr:PDZ domain-containing protein [Methylomirabilota bacterium]